LTAGIFHTILPYNYGFEADVAIVQTQEESDLQLVEQFFAERGLKAERIPEATTKTPDFKILQGGDVVAFCELKSPQDVFVERVEDTIKEGGSGIIETGYGNDYRQARCMARAATKAQSNLLPSTSVIWFPIF
jgi:hypothetical protein